MSALLESRRMSKPHTQSVVGEELERLFAEIVRYLEAVEVFRREGHEPTWRRDVVADAFA